jgi:hypothetical protein
LRKSFRGQWLALLFVLCLAGCSHAPKNPENSVIRLPDPYITAVQVVYSKTALQGKLERFSSGETRLTVDSPENIAGLTLWLQEGVLQAEYTGLCVSVNSAAAPASSVLTLLQDALCRINGEKMTLSRSLQLESEHGRLEVFLEEQSLLPQKILMPDLRFAAELSEPVPQAVG